jgi:hypothetical protein
MEAEIWRRFAALECPQEPLYVALCQLIAQSPALLALAARAPAEQRRPNLLLAALHERVLAGAGGELAAYYPSVGGTRPPDAALGAALQRLVEDQRDAIEQHLRHRATQTNEVARCAGLWPALAATAALTGRQDIALLDFGCSAGLNLGVDAYAYRYRLPSGEWLATGLPPDGERAEIEADWLGGAWPTAAWRLADRQGVDPQPIDLADPERLRWLRACLWPQDARRDERLRRAARTMRWPVRTKADCIAAIEPWLDGLPAGVQPLLFNSWVLTYLPDGELQRLRATVDRLALSHGLAWLNAELAALSARDRPAPPLPALTPDQVHGSPTLWTLRWPVAGRIEEQALLWSHPHGRWVAGLA